MIGRDRAADTGHPQQGGKTGIVLMPRGDQPLGDIGAIEPLERHHVANRGERHEIEPGKQVERARLRMTVLAQEPERRDQHEKHDTGGAQMPLPRQVVLAIGIDQGQARRHFVAHLVMVDDNYVDAALARHRQRLKAGRAAVDGHDQSGAAFDQLADRCRIGAVAFEDTVGNVDLRLQAEMGEESRQQRRGRGAVDVIVAEDRHALAAPDGQDQPFAGGFAIGQPIGIGHQGADRRIEKARRIVNGYTAASQHARHKLRQAVQLAHGEGAVLAGLVQPRHPTLARDRAVDA